MAKKSKDEKLVFSANPGTPSISTLQAVVNAINTHYGDGTIKKANDFPPIERIPTGSPWLDFALGGGIPKGRITLFSGDYSTCKTLISEMAIAYQQRFHSDEPVFRCDVEGSYDPEWAKTLGCNPDAPNSFLHQPDTAEQGLDVMDTVVRSMDGGIFLLDSLAMLTPMVEVEESLESWQRSIGARLVNKALRKLQAAMNKAGKLSRSPTVILINQERSGFDARGNNFTVRPYGKGQDFAASVIVEFRLGHEVRWNESKGKLIGWSRDMEDYGDPIGRYVKFHVTKNKTAPPLRRGEFEIYTAYGPHPHIAPGCGNEHEQILILAERHGVVSRSGAWYKFDGNNIGQGREKTVWNFLQDQDLYCKVYERVQLAERRWAEGSDAEVREETRRSS